MGVFPVSTQLELRSIMGILQNQTTIQDINKRENNQQNYKITLKLMSNLDLKT